jgi:integrase
MLYTRKDSPYLWFKFKVRGEPIRESTGTADRALAKRVEAKRRLELFEQIKLGLKPEHVWEEAVADYMDTQPEGDNKRNTRNTLRWLGKHLQGKALSSIDEDMLIEIRATKIREVNKRKAEAARRGRPSRWATCQPSYVNRIFTGVVSPILSYAKSRKWIAAVPEMPRLDEPKRDPTWATREKAMRLLALLPRHQKSMVIFDLEVGWRRSNVTHLRWDQVDLERRFAWVTADAAKEGKGIPTPLSDTAVEVLRRQVGLHPVYVFPYRGKPVEQTSTRAFRAARDAAGLPRSFTWHSLRHTWASWHRQDKTPLDVLKELGGWSSDRMVERYAHLGGEHLTPYVEARVAIEPGALAVLERGHESGHARKRKTSRVQSKALIAKQSGNSSVGRAQPCQGPIPVAPPVESET